MANDPSNTICYYVALQSTFNFVDQVNNKNPGKLILNEF